MSNKQQQQQQQRPQLQQQGRSTSAVAGFFHQKFTTKKGGSLCTILLLLLLVCQEIVHFYYLDNLDDTNMKVSKFILKHPQQQPQYKKDKNKATRGVVVPAEKSPEIIALETPCPKHKVPPFVTFAVYWIRGRWGRYGIPKAVRILYSSLSRTFNCAVELHVHTNYDRNPIKSLLYNNVTTTMGTIMTGLQFHPLNKKAWKHNNPFLNGKLNEKGKPSSWKALSRSKLETMEIHFNDNQYFYPVWIDLDTILLHPSAIMISSSSPSQSSSLNNNDKKLQLLPQQQHMPKQRPFVYGYQQIGVRNRCFGDIFALDQQTIDDIRTLEKHMIANKILLPEYDLQGYFKLMLDENSTRFDIVQDIYPNYTFGFDCTQYAHPKVELIKTAIHKNKNHNHQQQQLDDGSNANGNGNDEGGLVCKNPRNGNERSKVGCLSFTSKTYCQFFFQQPNGCKGRNQKRDISTSIFDVIEDTDARDWLKEFLFGTSPIAI